MGSAGDEQRMTLSKKASLSPNWKTPTSSHLGPAELSTAWNGELKKERSRLLHSLLVLSCSWLNMQLSHLTSCFETAKRREWKKRMLEQKSKRKKLTLKKKLASSRKWLLRFFFCWVTAAKQTTTAQQQKQHNSSKKQDMDLFKIAVVFAVFGRSHNNKENKIKSRIKGVVGKRVRVDRTTRTGSIGLWIYTLFYNSWKITNLFKIVAGKLANC